MAHKFNDDEKEVKEFSESLPFGVNKVQFTGAITDETDAGKEFVEVGVVNKAGIEDSARCWFVGGASNISFNTLRTIAVHQGKDDEAKAKIRDRVDNVADSQELVDVLNDVCGDGGELWFSRYYDPKRTYEAQDGSVRKSVNKNIYGYEPKEKPELMGDGEITKDNIDKVFPGNEKVTDAADTVPKDDDWAK